MRFNSAKETMLLWPRLCQIQSCTSTAGAGTRFTVRLPAEAPAGTTVSEDYPTPAEAQRL